MRSVLQFRAGVKDTLFHFRSNLTCRHGSVFEKNGKRSFQYRRIWCPYHSIQNGRLGSEYIKCASTAQPGIFPSGKKQPQLNIPALVISVAAKDVLEDSSTLRVVSLSVAGGATAVLLRDDDSNSGELYEAALQIQEKLRDRAALFIMGRSDIAEAVDANGVLLTKQGVPLAVARRTLNQRSILLGRIVETTEEVRQVAAEGASFVCMLREGGQISSKDLKRAKEVQKGGTIPVLPIVDITAYNTEKLTDYLCSATDGVVLDQKDLKEIGSACGIGTEAAPDEIVSAVKQFLQQKTSIKPTPAAETSIKPTLTAETSIKPTLTAETSIKPTPAPEPVEEERKPRRLLLTENREKLLQREKETLSRCLETLRNVSPKLEEIFLLEGALRQLDELFLVVVVGEYNSGKSSVINALLGSRYLDEGILPTTNEICVLRFAESTPTVKTLPDGVVERTLPAALLQEINIVDTPGTNVVLERQQRLTEEYVPRADMVLFVLSCDRPFTESEVKFLEYIRKWGKKVIFVVNKVDILSGDKDIEAVSAFVSQNARRLLNLSEAFVWPVSARKALDAKMAIGDSSFGGLYPTSTAADLEQDRRWQSSRFSSLESFVSEFFSGSEGAASAESVRLKLQTPLYVADALLDASRRQLENERIAAENDVAASKQVSVQLVQFEKEMRRDSGVQQQVLKTMLEKVATRAETFVDETLLVSNFFALRGYLSEGSSIEAGESSRVVSGFRAGVLGNLFEEVKEVDSQHEVWLSKNCTIQLTNYESFAEKCAHQFSRSLDSIIAEHQSETQDTTPASKDSQVASPSELTETQVIAAAIEKTLNKMDSGLVMQMVLQNPVLGIQLSEVLIESEIRNAVNATGGTALAAIAVGLVLTVILPKTAEDLLAISLSVLIGYVALLNLPLRRGEIKSRIRKAVSMVGEELSQRLERELTSSVNETTKKVNQMIEPLQVLFKQELDTVMQNEKLRAEVEKDLTLVRKEILNIE